jgi:hypothetical protein
MNRLMLAGAALLLAAAVAPAVAQPAENPPPTGPAAAAPPAAPGGGMVGPGMMGPGMMGRGGWRHRRMMMRWLHQSPRQRCIDRMARHAGMIAYVVTKLDLTPQQRPLWNKVEAALNAAGERQRHLCNALPASAQAWRQQTILDRLARRETFLSARLHDLQQIEPVLQQFYRSLTPAQQAIINHPFRPN